MRGICTEKKIYFYLNYGPRKSRLSNYRVAALLKIDITRMTTFIKTMFKISDDQTNIDKSRLSAKLTVYHIISKLIFLELFYTR